MTAAARPICRDVESAILLNILEGRGARREKEVRSRVPPCMASPPRRGASLQDSLRPRFILFISAHPPILRLAPPALRPVPRAPRLPGGIAPRKECRRLIVFGKRADKASGGQMTGRAPGGRRVWKKILYR